MLTLLDRPCGYPTDNGPCLQPPGPEGGPCYYHAKVDAGLAQPCDKIFGDEELRALLTGRHHGDGRRLDHWVIEDPIAWDKN